MRYATYAPSADAIAAERKWYVIDAEGMNLGRLATRIAVLLRGKHKADFSPNLEMGDYVIVLNADKVTVTGQKREEEFYYRHSQYPGGLRKISLKEMTRTHPERVVELTVKGMLPHNRLGRKIIRNLHVYTGTAHPHAAQTPITIDVPEARK